VIEAVEKDEIDVERYSSYAKLYEEAKASVKARLENR
jgi:hypothetical protein